MKKTIIASIIIITVAVALSTTVVYAAAVDNFVEAVQGLLDSQLITTNAIVDMFTSAL